MKLPLKTVSMQFMLFIAISSLFLSPASAEVLEVQPTEAYEIEVKKLVEELAELTGGEEFSELDEEQRLMVSEKIVEFFKLYDKRKIHPFSIRSGPMHIPKK